MAAPDYENALDADGNHIYEVTVVVTDGVFSDTQALSISVTDANEFAISPISDSNATGDSVAENAVGVTAFANDADGIDTVTYSLNVDAGGRFAIDPNSGIVTVSGVID